jgi:dTDP-glucose pyrophosphorylase
MAGLGSRFKHDGFTVPKYKIIAKNRSLFEWSMLSLYKFFNQKFIFVVLMEDDVKWIRSKAQELGIKDFDIISRKVLSRGQAETAYEVIKDQKNNGHLWIYNIDTYVVDGLDPKDMLSNSGCIPVFKSNNPGMSYVGYDSDCNVNQVVEKKVISDWATVGLYGFDSAKTYCELYETYYVARIYNPNIFENYVAPMYEVMLSNKLKINAPKIDAKNVWILGTPSQVLLFDNKATPPMGNV